MIRIVFHLLLLCFVPIRMQAQYFLEANIAYSDSFREWNIIMEKDSQELEGRLELTWAFRGDFTEWRYDLGNNRGDITQKFANNPGLWELRSENRVVSMRQVWPGDPTEWKIECEGRSFVFLTAQAGILDEWILKTDKYGELVLYTDRIGDPRDWLIADYMDIMISLEERLAAIFIGLYTSTPKF